MRAGTLFSALFLLFFWGRSIACTVDRTPPTGGGAVYQRVFSRDCAPEERRVEPDEVLSALREGKVIRVRGGRIDGLDLRKAAMDGKLAGSVMLVDSEISGEVRGDGVRFLGDMIFWNSVFSGPVDLARSSFARFVDFRGALLRGEAVFSGAEFLGAAGFIGVAFGGVADFSSARFVDSAGFGRSTFSGGASFAQSRFGHHADFSWASFGGRANFREARFSRSADFGRATFSGSADFSAAEFEGEGSFRWSAFLQDLSFDGVKVRFGLTLLGLDYRRFAVYLALLFGLCALSLFLVGTAFQVARNYPSPRRLFGDVPFMAFALFYLGALTIFYFYPTFLLHPPSPRETLNFLVGVYSLTASVSYPAYLFACAGRRSERLI
jgi:uncharacterized protein YjbI with pentapeptide repeats